MYNMFAESNKKKLGDSNTENAENFKQDNNTVEQYLKKSDTKDSYKKKRRNEDDEDTKLNYIQNGMFTNSSGELCLVEARDDFNFEDTLLSQTNTIVRFSPIWRQSLAASAAILLTFTAGLTSGYSAILLPQLKQENGTIPYDENTASWIASIAALPMAAGCLLAGWMLEKFGRRHSHYIVCVPFLVGWIIIVFANNLTLMLIGRFLTGLCVGLLGPLCPVYIGETSEPKYRGFLLAGISLAIAIGILVVHVLGTFMTWQWTAAISCLFPIISMILLAWIPESPTWLISKGQIDVGVKSFVWLRGYGEEAKKELQGIIEGKRASDSGTTMNWRENLVLLKSFELLKPLFIMIIMFLTCQFSGVNAVAYYSVVIVEKAVGKGIDHYLAMLIIDSLRTIMSVVACVLCKHYGRRPLCMISGIWTALSMVGLSTFLYWKPENMVWLPLTCLMVYICAISIGLVPLPWMMCGEVFPTRVKGLGSGISSAITFTAIFVVVKTAPGMLKNFGEVITFLFYGVISLIGTAAMYFILPETKGKSLQEIEERLTNSKKPGTTV